MDCLSLSDCCSCSFAWGNARAQNRHSLNPNECEMLSPVGEQEGGVGGWAFPFRRIRTWPDYRVASDEFCRGNKKREIGSTWRWNSELECVWRLSRSMACSTQVTIRGLGGVTMVGVPSTVLQNCKGVGGLGGVGFVHSVCCSSQAVCHFLVLQQRPACVHPLL